MNEEACALAVLHVITKPQDVAQCRLTYKAGKMSFWANTIWPSNNCLNICRQNNVTVLASQIYNVPNDLSTSNNHCSGGHLGHGQTTETAISWDKQWKRITNIIQLIKDTAVRNLHCRTEKLVFNITHNPQNRWPVNINLNWLHVICEQATNCKHLRLETHAALSAVLLVLHRRTELAFKISSQIFPTTNKHLQMCRTNPVGRLVDWQLIWHRNVTRFSLGWQIDSVDLECSFFAVGIQRWTDVFHHPDTHATPNYNIKLVVHQLQNCNLCFSDNYTKSTVQLHWNRICNNPHLAMYKISLRWFLGYPA